MDKNISTQIMEENKCFLCASKFIEKGQFLTRQSHPLKVNGFVTVTQIARKINMPTHWIYDRIHNRKINASKDHKGRYLFPDTEETLQIFIELKNQTL
jgi:hypothetical protein